MINVYQDRTSEAATVVHHTYTIDQYGSKTNEVETDIKARVDKKLRWVKNIDGETEESSIMLVLNRDTVLTRNDDFTVDSTKYHIVIFDYAKAFKRINHIEVYLA